MLESFGDGRVKFYWTFSEKETHYLIARLWFSFLFRNGICRVHMYLRCPRLYEIDAKTTGEFLPGQGPRPDSARSWPRTWRLSDWRVCRPGRSTAGLVPAVASDPLEQWWSDACPRFFVQLEFFCGKLEGSPPLLALGLFEAQRESVAKKLQ